MSINDLLEKLIDSVSLIMKTTIEHQNEIDASSDTIKQFIKLLYDIFHHQPIYRSNEEIDEKLSDFLQIFLDEQNELFIYQYVDSFSQNKQIEKKIAGVLILILQEKILSGLFVAVMGDKIFKTNYNEKAALLNAKFIYKLIEEIQKLEQTKLSLKSKWIENYLSRKIVEKKINKRIDFDIMSPISKARTSKLESLEKIKTLDKNDPILAWISDQKHNGVNSLEVEVKRKFKQEHRSKSSNKNGDSNSGNSEIRLPRDTIDIQNVNKMYNTILKYNQPEVSIANSNEGSKETFIKEDGISSQLIYDKFIFPHLSLISKFGLDPTTKPINDKLGKCPDCGIEMTSGFLGVNL